MWESPAVLTGWHPSRLTHMAILDAVTVWAFSPGCQQEYLHGPPHDLNSHGMKAGSERNIPREQVRMPNEELQGFFWPDLRPKCNLGCFTVFRACCPGSRGRGWQSTSWWGKARSLSRRACGMEDVVVAIFGKCSLPPSISESPLERTP